MPVNGMMLKTTFVLSSLESLKVFWECMQFTQRSLIFYSESMAEISWHTHCTMSLSDLYMQDLDHVSMGLSYSFCTQNTMSWSVCYQQKKGHHVITLSEETAKPTAGRILRYFSPVFVAGFLSNVAEIGQKCCNCCELRPNFHLLRVAGYLNHVNTTQHCILSSLHPEKWIIDLEYLNILIGLQCSYNLC